MNIKEKIKSSGFKQWEIAEVMGISEFTLSRYLRRPEKLAEITTNQINKAIERLEKEVR